MAHRTRKACPWGHAFHIRVMEGGCQVRSEHESPSHGRAFVLEGGGVHLRGWGEGPGTRQTRKARPLDVLFV